MFWKTFVAIRCCKYLIISGGYVSFGKLEYVLLFYC